MTRPDEPAPTVQSNAPWAAPSLASSAGNGTTRERGPVVTDQPTPLAQDVLKRHVAHVHDDVCAALNVNTRGCISGGMCSRCIEPFPCDAYRLAVIIRDVEALAQGWSGPGGGTGTVLSRILAFKILAITREETE